MKCVYKLLVALTFLLPVLALAQTNYKPGYMVTLKGDTLHGFVDYKEWDRTPGQISFKANLNTRDAEKLTPQNIAAFGVNGFEVFESFTLPISLYAVEVSKLPVGLDTATALTTVFLKMTATGKNIALYYYKDDIKERFFIKDKAPGKIRELVYRAYLNPKDVNQIITQARFRFQLQEIAKKYGHGDEKLMRKIELAEYAESEIIAIVNTINDVSDKNKPANLATKKAATRFFAGVGVSKGDMSYTGAITVASNSTSRASFSPKIDFGMDAFLNPEVGQLMLRLELSFFTADLKVATNSSAQLYAEQTGKQATVSLTPQLIYNVYNTSPLKIYLGGGAAVNVSSYSNNNYRYAQETYSGQTVEVKNYPNMLSTWISLFAKTGVILNNKFEIYLSYTPPATITAHYASFSGDVTFTQAGIHYFFGSKH